MKQGPQPKRRWGASLRVFRCTSNLYALAFFQGNVAAMKQQADWAIGKPGAEDWMLSLESDTEAWSGRLGKARELSRQAVESARRSDKKEPAALWQANAAIREALFGNADAARQRCCCGSWRSRQVATMRRRRQRWPMRWRAMRRTPNHLRMTSPSASRRIPSCNRSGCLLPVRR